MLKKIVIAIVVATVIAALGFGIFIGIRDGIFADLYQDITDPVSFDINDTLPNSNGEVARVIILGGQSNASGCSRVDYLEKNVSEEKFEEYKNGYDNVYINYFVTGMNISDGFVRCAANQGELGGFFGPELGMAEKLNELYPDENFYIIKYAWGGTNLYDQWLSPSSRGKTGQMYRQFEGFVKTSLEYLASKGYDVKIEGMCWMQGESDSMADSSTLSYEKNLLTLISDVRTTFAEYAAEDGIAFIDAYISECIFWKNYVKLNQAKQTVADSSSLNVVIDTIAEGLTVTEEPADEPDIAHYDSLSEIKLGNMFAEELAKFLQ